MRFKSLYPWDLAPQHAVSLQNKLRSKIKIKKWMGTLRLIAGVDAAFKRDKATGAVVVLDYPEFKIIEQVCKTTKIPYPYIPGLLTFREGPVLGKCFSALRHKPDIIIFDGQGIAHPRNMGIATHMGILLDKTTIGCAKTHLFGEYTEPQNQRGAFSYLLDKQGKRIGAVLRTKNFVKPIFVSPGHKIDIDSSLRVILMCTKKYRIPEAIRLAH